MYNTGAGQLMAWLISSVIDLISLVIIVEIIVSWAVMLGARGINPNSPWVRMLNRITDPILGPIRRVLPPRSMGGWDLSPIIALFVLRTVQGIVLRALA